MKKIAFEELPPVASAIVESLRAFGYSPGTAIADLIDNSITAGAKNIWLDFHWAGSKSHIAVRDDGTGMTVDVLTQAMRLGSTNPKILRTENDLGRFGLGLKTAAFSLARCLTVWSKSKGHAESIRCWDLDVIQQTNQWYLSTQSTGLESLEAMKPSTTGTLVILEKLDRLIDGDIHVENHKMHDEFLEIVEVIKNHLEMVFHRYIEERKLDIWINDRKLSPWNPFLTNESATQILPEETLTFKNKKITVQAFVLPHISKINKAKHEAGAGIRGWNAHQGFYIYRNKRLLVAGDWLGLGYRKEEHYKLCRIRLDIPNSMDEEWHIDVRKSTARPPAMIRDGLRKIANLARNRAVEVYRHRGKILLRRDAQPETFLWNKRWRGDKIVYEVNRNHPLYKSLELDRDQTKRVNNLLRLLEETVPIPLIVIDNTETPSAFGKPFEGVSKNEISALIHDLLAMFTNQGFSQPSALEKISSMEPFTEYPEIINEIMKSDGGSNT